MSARVDTTRLTATLKRYARELDLSLPKVVRHQAGLFKAEVVNTLPPKNLKKSQAKAVKDTKKVFFTGEKPLDIFFGSQAQGAGMRWLYAGNKGGRFLVGVQPDDFQPGMGVKEMQREQNELLRGHFRGAGWHLIGQRGKNNPFKIFRVNRTVVRRGQREQLNRKLMDNFGRLKASFAMDWERFNIAKPLRNWIRKHVPNARGRTLDFSKLPDKPFVEMISTAHGVSKPQALKAINAAVKKRVGAMTADLRNQLKGAYKRAGFANAR